MAGNFKMLRFLILPAVHHKVLKWAKRRCIELASRQLPQSEGKTTLLGELAAI
jgi:hypothetical protein